MPAIRHVKAVGVSSLLDLTGQQWRQSAGSQARKAALFLIDARNALESLRNGTGFARQVCLELLEPQIPPECERLNVRLL